MNDGLGEIVWVLCKHHLEFKRFSGAKGIGEILRQFWSIEEKRMRVTKLLLAEVRVSRLSKGNPQRNGEE